MFGIIAFAIGFLAACVLFVCYSITYAEKDRQRYNRVMLRFSHWLCTVGYNWYLSIRWYAKGGPIGYRISKYWSTVMYHVKRPYYWLLYCQAYSETEQEYGPIEPAPYCPKFWRLYYGTGAAYHWLLWHTYHRIRFFILRNSPSYKARIRYIRCMDMYLLKEPNRYSYREAHVKGIR